MHDILVACVVILGQIKPKEDIYTYISWYIKTHFSYQDPTTQMITHKTTGTSCKIEAHFFDELSCQIFTEIYNLLCFHIFSFTEQTRYNREMDSIL